ncbi:MAG TPA: DUF3443 family protein [Candidatus Acidoferrales bacterium]|nr:DUF3443 family protein [Candidatus Acidoferrales bacterium]
MTAAGGFTRFLRHGWPVALLTAGLASLAACGGGYNAPRSGGGGGQPNNLQAVQVNLGPAGNDVDTLLASVTVCLPGTSTCQIIQDVNVDTGSEGLRILASQTGLHLPQEKDASGNPLGNCITFADNSYIWGPVVVADVQIAGEQAASVPVQIIGDPNFATVPAACNTGGAADDTVTALGANAILGVGVFRQDCGAACAGNAAQAPNVYFSCPNSGCSIAAVPLQNQLQNPVWLFPQDNNGLLLSLPSVPATGSSSVSGSLIFGVGTQSNNGLGSVQVYTTDAQGNFTTTFNGTPYSSSFIDSGSSGFFFLDSATTGMPACTGGNSGFYCPASTMNFSATNTGANGASAAVSFTIANAMSLFQSGNSAYSNLGGPNSGTFDWGLAFFFGRQVFVGIENQNSPAGPGPYWAY